jgi:hypothetical protein
MVQFILIPMMEKFGFTLKIIFKKVMGILDKITQGSSSQKEEDFSLEKHEIEFILLLLKESTFKGEYVEILYNIAYKLQQQYLKK